VCLIEGRGEMKGGEVEERERRVRESGCKKRERKDEKDRGERKEEK